MLSYTSGRDVHCSLLQPHVFRDALHFLALATAFDRALPLTVEEKREVYRDQKDGELHLGL
jgi:hypothetical protein